MYCTTMVGVLFQHDTVLICGEVLTFWPASSRTQGSTHHAAVWVVMVQSQLRLLPLHLAQQLTWMHCQSLCCLCMQTCMWDNVSFMPHSPQ